jgi:hypothetical protein
MVSAFQSRELGFGLKLTLEELNCIHSFRQSCHFNYTEAETAIKVNEGAGKKVWLSLHLYDHMAVQFENCMDCIQALYPHFDTV